MALANIVQTYAPLKVLASRGKLSEMEKGHPDSIVGPQDERRLPYATGKGKAPFP